MEFLLDMKVYSMPRNIKSTIFSNDVENSMLVRNCSGESDFGNEFKYLLFNLTNLIKTSLLLIGEYHLSRISSFDGLTASY